MSDTYTIKVGDKVLYKGLSQLEYFERLDDLAIEYYQTGHPKPELINTIIIGDNGAWRNQKQV